MPGSVFQLKSAARPRRPCQVESVVAHLEIAPSNMLIGKMEELPNSFGLQILPVVPMAPLVQ